MSNPTPSSARNAAEPESPSAQQAAETDRWRAGVSAELRDGDRRMDALAAEMAAVKRQLQTNSEATARVEANTAEMLTVFTSWQGAMRALDMLGKVAKPLGYIVGACAAAVGFWTALKTGGAGK